MNRKMMLATVGLATLLTSPALAQYEWQPGPWGYRSSYATAFDIRPLAPAYRSTALRSYALAPARAYRRTAYEAYALAPGAAFAQSYPLASAYGARSFGSVYGPTLLAPRRFIDVIDIRGDYVGADPDGRVRDQLARDPTQGD
jgi:hypothetical protein